MQKELQLVLAPGDAANMEHCKGIIARNLRIPVEEVMGFRILRKSVDSRRGEPRINLSLIAFIKEPVQPLRKAGLRYRNVTSARRVIIIGAGPAGLFAALRLIELGLKPVILERGKAVEERKRDIARISRQQLINPDSNYCFGEGGAGTFSDGKLYTRSRKRGDHRRILEILHWHGAADPVLYDAHPHIGSDKLPGIIKQIRNTITGAGGEIHFHSRISGLILRNNRISRVMTADGTKIPGQTFILATGHSARDIFQLLHDSEIVMEAKPFAMGIRIEHPQELIDSIQYHRTIRGKYLPPATYALAEQADGRGVYSFCMCPGGFIVPSATAPGEVVVNGMSPSGRNSPYANSGIVVEVRIEDIPEFRDHGALAGLEFQKMVERLAWEEGGRRQTAPAQRLTDFMEGKASRTLPATSYAPGVVSSGLHGWLPPAMVERLRTGFRAFDNSMRGFITREAILLGVESRTSSPLRIPRDPDLLHHPMVTNLYPCGEGSGYAGGIVSSAVDGERVAEKVAEQLRREK